MLSSIVFPLFFFLFFFREEIFSFVFKNKYHDSVPIFAISIFILPLRVNNYSVILQCFSEGKKVLLGSLIDIVIAIVLMITLYPVMGSRGIVLSIVISTYCQVLYYLWHSAKILKIKMYELFPVKKLIVKFLILLVLYFIIFFIVTKFFNSHKIDCCCRVYYFPGFCRHLELFENFLQKKLWPYFIK